MNAVHPHALPRLVRHTRNTLWRRRVLRAAWQGCGVAAIALLALAAVHLAWRPVPLSAWLPCLLLPPLLAMSRAALWQRPGAAEAAAELDRQGACDDLLITAWELLARPATARPATAALVLHRADELCSRVRLVPGEAPLSAWRGRYAAAPVTALLIALFLLQLPTSPAPVPARENSTARLPGGAAGPWWPQPDGTRAAAAAQAPASSDDSTAGAPATRPVAASGPPGGEATVRAADPAAGNGAHSTAVVAGPDPAGAIDTGAAPGDAHPQRGGPQTGGDAAGGRVATGYEDIPRGGKESSRRLVAGTDSGALDAPQSARLDPQPVIARAATAAQRLPAAYSNRFSHAQRAQISAYFDRLEESQ